MSVCFDYFGVKRFYVGCVGCCWLVNWGIKFDLWRLELVLILEEFALRRRRITTKLQ
jgi:hypothetical protein